MKKNETEITTLTSPLSYIFTFYILATITITLAFSHQQLIVGTVVNSLLFFTAFHIEKKYHWPIAIFPSIVAVFQGLLFGKLTIFLVYFLPFIWMANYILIFTAVKFKKDRILRFLLPVFLKFIFLLTIANLYVNFKIVPKIFLQAMGYFQLITACLGYFLFLLINKLINLKND